MERALRGGAELERPGNMLRGPGRLRGYRGAGNREGRCEQRGDTACDQKPEERESGRKRQNMSRDDKAWGRGNAGTTSKTMQQGVEIGKVPKEWRNGIIIPLPKKVDIRECSNWRGITLVATINLGKDHDHCNTKPH